MRRSVVKLVGMGGLFLVLWSGTIQVVVRSKPLSSGRVGSIVERDPALRLLVPVGASVEKLADGFAFTEGPVWFKNTLDVLLFSDIPNNSIMQWSPKTGIRLFRKPSGYTGPPAPPGTFIGSNGLTLDASGRLTICEHGNRRVTRLEKDGKLTILADRYQGKRLNSPNDAVYRSDGSLYFTDPPYGLLKPEAKELDYHGIYRLSPKGELQLVAKDMSFPNGLAFSPNEKTLYVANSDPKEKIWVAYDVSSNGGLSGRRIFYDVTPEKDEGVPDGLKVDARGNLYCTGPGGIWVFSPQGKHLGTIKAEQVPANCHWGDKDGRTLYMTARTGLYRIRLNVAGIRP